MDRIQLEELPDFHQFNQAILGSFSLIAGKGKNAVKYLEQHSCFSYHDVFETPSFHFRRWASKVQFPKRDAYPFPSYPYLSKVSQTPYAFYLDIRQAYLQLARVWGAECYIVPEKCACYGENTLNEALFVDHKVVRGLLITGLSREGHYTKWIDQKLQTVKFSNSSHAPHLRGAIMCTLHAIMADCLPFILYAHTDGMIVPSWHLERVQALLSQWGLIHAIKHEGFAHITGVGSYRIGSFATETYRRNLYSGTQSNIWIESKDWWKQKYITGLNRRLKFNHFSSPL
jgi:hypothetical protein